MDFSSIQKRWGITLPADYISFWEAGLLSSKSSHVVWFSDVQWLAPSDIAGFLWPPLFKPIYVPFARSGRMDLYCWKREAPHYVVWCPRSEAFGKQFAKDFRASVYRLFLEELTCCRLADVLEIGPDNVNTRLHSYVDQLQTHFDSDWLVTLQMLLARKPRRDGDVLVYATNTEIDQIIEQSLVFESLNAPVSHFQD